MVPNDFVQDENTISLMVADHITAMLAYWDKDLVCRFANKAYLEWFGKSRQEMVDKMTIRDLLGPLYEKNLPYIQGALNGKNQTFEREIITPCGGLRYTLASYFPHIENDEILGFFAHVADITTVKLLEKDLLRSNEKIKDQNKRLLNFANIVTHNLKSFSNNLNILLEIIDSADSEEEKAEMFLLLKGLSKGFKSTLVNLTEIADAQNISHLKLEPINLHDYINKAIQILLADIKTSHAIIKNNVTPNLTVTANAAYLESIVLNFITNSIKYKHPNRNPIIELSTSNTGNEILFTIKDNGLGIDLEKHRPNLFGMYKTFHNNPEAKGVGLFLVKSQVEAMGWEIEVESIVNEGTTFIITINQ